MRCALAQENIQIRDWIKAHAAAPDVRIVPGIARVNSLAARLYFLQLRERGRFADHQLAD
jgi:5,10-methylenetetrahydrofolate reductase